MIPKIIHYCWFGQNTLPESAIKCINSWRKYLPEYEIKEWNEDDFDVNMIPYTKEAYKAKKYAFVSDFARFWILEKYGGIYFDTDVEVIKQMDSVISQGPFMGCEVDAGITKRIRVAPGLGIAAYPNMPFLQSMVKYYEGISFLTSDGSYNQTTICEHTTNLLIESGLSNTKNIQKCEGFIIYPKEYFCPLDYSTGELNITNNTYTIHHYMASWHSMGQKMFIFLSRFLSKEWLHKVSMLLKKWKIAK